MSKPNEEAKEEEQEEGGSPLEREMAQAAVSEETARPSATDEEIEAGAIFSGEPPSDAETPSAEEGASAVSSAELEALRAQADEYLDGWQRARAEFANYKKRVEREQEDSRGRATAAILAKILPIADDLDRALRDQPGQDDARAWAQGIELIQRKLEAILEAEGVETIPAEGQAFDPELHEAVTYEENDDHNEGQVIEVIQKGYRLGERVLRPARVRVAK